MSEIVALGELLVDFTSTAVDSEGYPYFTAHPGGAPANYLACLSKFGHETALIAKVGQDAFGDMLIDAVKEFGIDSSHIIKAEDCFTTLAFVSLDKNGEREFSFARKPGADTQLREEEIDSSIIDEAKVFHFGTLSLTDEPARTTTKTLVEYAKLSGKIISFDPNIRKPLWKDLEDAKAQALWGFSVADVVKVSDEEIEFIFGCDARKGATLLNQKYGVKLALVSCGKDGAYYCTKNAIGHVESLHVSKVVDTTGAGDIFGGSAMHMLLEKNKEIGTLTDADLREICKFACAAAGLSVKSAGGMSSIPKLSAVKKLVK